MRNKSFALPSIYQKVERQSNAQQLDIVILNSTIALV
jgi:hypothetical protein